MRHIPKKVLSTLLTLTLTLVFVAGTIEIAEMASGHPVVSHVLGSDGDGGDDGGGGGGYVPPTPVEKKTNTLSAKGHTVSLTGASLTNKSRTIARKDAITVSNPQGTVTYAKKSGNNKITINKSTGVITVQKGLGIGTYKLVVNVKAAGNGSYKAKTVQVTVTIKVVTATNPITVKPSTETISTEDLGEEDVVIPKSEAMTISQSKGKLSYSSSIGSEGLTLDTKTGDIIVDKDLEPGTYKIEVKVKDSGSVKYKPATRYVVVTVKIKDPNAPDESEPKLKDKLIAKWTAKGGNALTLTWNKVDGAEGYDVFFGRCSKSHKSRFVKSLGPDKTTWTKKGLVKNKPYKAFVKAWKMVDGEKKYFRMSPPLHAYTAGGSKLYTNPSKLTINRSEILLREDGTFAVKATVKKLSSGKILILPSHCARVRYYTTDKNVVTVSKTGKIKAVAKGTCKVYVITSNGIKKAILVTVC